MHRASFAPVLGFVFLCASSHAQVQQEWTVTIPANGRATLRYVIRDPSG